jgi:GNAT superfamily N-acetyltransferase
MGWRDGQRAKDTSGMIEYRPSAQGLTPDHLRGFFVDWAKPPQPETHLRLLRQSALVMIAWDSEAERVVGFCTALTDGVLTAYIPYLEVLPDWQGRGIGSELFRRMIQRLKGLYAVDLLCDPGLQSYYSRFKMMPVAGMMLRRYELQTGARDFALPPAARASMIQRLKSLLTGR